MDEQGVNIALPRTPSKGQRRKLEALWLVALEEGGLSGEAIQPQGEMPAQLCDAVELFNKGLYWECHEVLEEVWLETPYPQRFFWSALIKLAVGMHHAERHNLHGARVKMADAVRLLPLFQPQCLGVDTTGVLADALRWQETLNAPRPDWATVDMLPKPVIALETK